MTSAMADGIRTIVVAVAGSLSSERALRLASEMAHTFRAELTIFDSLAVQEIPTLIAEALAQGVDDEWQVVPAQAVRIAREFGVEARTEVRRGMPADQIVRFCSESPPDLLVLGTRVTSGSKGSILGSVSRAVRRRTRARMVLVRWAFSGLN